MYVICDFLLLYWLAIYVFLLSISLFVIEHSFYYLRRSKVKSEMGR